MDRSKFEQNPVVKRVGVQLLKVHERIYVGTGGRIGHRILGVPCLLLWTTGAKTGAQRVNGLTYARDGDRYLVVPSNGGASRSPGWYHNLRAEPACEVQLGTKRFAATSRVINADDADFQRAWELVNRGNAHRYTAYQRSTTRPIPVVELRRAAA